MRKNIKMRVNDMSLDALTDLVNKSKVELTHHNKERKRLRNLIENATTRIAKLSYKPNADRLRINSLINRDMTLCIDYIKKYKKMPTREIIDLLNNELKDKETRWKGDLDSNRFMTYMGKYLKNEMFIGMEKNIDPISKRKTTYWYIKIN